MKRSRKYENAIKFQDQGVPDFLKPYKDLLEIKKYSNDSDEENNQKIIIEKVLFF